MIAWGHPESTNLCQGQNLTGDSFSRRVFHWEKTYGSPLLAAGATNKFHDGIVFHGGGGIHGGHIVSWFDLEMCSKVIENNAIGQNTYDFLLVFYSNLARSLIASTLQSILCRNDLVGRLWPLSDSEGHSGSPPKWNHLAR